MKALTKRSKIEFFNTKKIDILRKTLNNQSDKNHFQKHMIYSKIFLGLIIKQLSTHKSHLNTYNYINKIGIYRTLDLCVVCVNQV